MRLAAGLLLLLALAPAAGASADLEFGLEDERILLEQPERVGAVTRHWSRLGVEAVRVHARWRDRRDLSALDGAVAAIRGAGLKVQLTVTGKVHRPDPRRYARFARRVATRYRGQVARYLIWNEPNVGGWLMPQARCRADRCVPASPHLYRRLVRAAVPAVHAADPGAPVLIGELASVGDEPESPRSTIKPLTFLRALACVDREYRPRTSGRCARFSPAAADAFGHHPHGQRASPARPSADRDWAKIADLGRLETVLDRLTAARRIIAPGDRFDIWLTEFGYQTRPAEPAGITAGHQAQWLQLAAYRAWRDPRIRSLTLYQWEDEPGHVGWQSGLRFADGRPKPALRGARIPLVVDRDRGRVWAQVRAGGAHTVTLERRGPGGWAPIGGPLRTDDRGAVLMPLALRTGDGLRLRAQGRRTGPVTVPPAGLAAPRR